MIQLPVKKEERIALCRSIFYDLKEHGLNDTKCIKGVLKILGGSIKERVLWNYRILWMADEEKYAKIEVPKVSVDNYVSTVPPAKAITIKVNNKPKKVNIPKINEKKIVVTQSAFDEAYVKGKGLIRSINPKDINWLDPNGEYDEKGIKAIVKEVCNEMTQGVVGFMHILDSKGISMNLWNRWIDSDDELRLMYERAKDQQAIAYMTRIQDGMKKIVMMFLDMNETEEVTIQYEIIKEIDPSNPEEFIYREEPKMKFVRRKPQKPDATTVKTVMDMIKQTMLNSSQMENDDMNKLYQMSESELEAELNYLKVERDNRNANREADTGTVEQAD